MNFQNVSSYNVLKKHSVFLSDIKIIDLFKNDKQRFSKFSRNVGDILFDFSKNLIDEKGLETLIKMAEQVGLTSQIDAMFNGDKINLTEGRAVLHTALRYNEIGNVKIDGILARDYIDNNFNLMFRFANDIGTGNFKGSTGKRILDVVNIGIGGSYLGPKMAVEALSPYKNALINFHFVSNVDATDIVEVLKKVSPETTLFIVASKTFTTDETMCNAQTAREWLVDSLGEGAVASHFCAVSTNIKLCREFGIDEKNIFAFGDYIGGRYSVWGPIGLSLAIAIGVDNFKEFLHGAMLVDEHFKNTDFSNNVPVLMGLLSIWNINFLGYEAVAVLPYDNYLKYLPLYLQQLIMESNGKSVDRGGHRVSYQTSPIIFGDEGTNGQHSFYQLLHQGTPKIVCDFILSGISHNEKGDHQLKLLANGIAQSEALMCGKGRNEVEAELKSVGMSSSEISKVLESKIFDGNRVSNTFLVSKITPAVLGSLIALYEHKTFVEGVLWDINSFDQFGVELGKKLASTIEKELKSDGDDYIENHDSSTVSLISIVKEIRTEI